MNIPESCGIYIISDCKNYTIENLLKKTEKILKTGISIFQFRDKNNNYDLKKIVPFKLQALCKRYNTPFIINDDVILAKTISADGVHLGMHDMPITQAKEILGDKIIGVSCYNNLDCAINAELNGADYVALGSFYASKTKKYPPTGPRTLYCIFHINHNRTAREIYDQLLTVLHH